MASRSTKARRPAMGGGPLPRGASRVLWTLGHLLMLVGVYLVVAVGGVYASVTTEIAAAHGDSDRALTATAAAPSTAPTVPMTPAQPATAVPFVPPRLAADDQVTSAVPAAVPVGQVATVSRVVIESIGVDSKVVEVGWDVVEDGGQQYAIWQVAEYAVGQHRGSANPGEGDNIVLAGHVGGYGKVFKDLYNVAPGDPITLYSNGQQYLYTVQERLVVQEDGMPEAQREANAQLLAPTGHEMVTLITCWPRTGKDRFTQRVIVRAVPYGGDAAASVQRGPSAWMIR